MRFRMQSLLTLSIALLAGCAGGGNDSATTPPGGSGKVGHVFIIVLENKGYDETFGANSPAPYLSQTLPTQGQLLTHYYGIGHESLDNYIAMVSGQAPNAITQADCIAYLDWIGVPAALINGQVLGEGCVYPAIVKTVANQLQDASLSWKGYMEDMGNDTSREPATCGHPPLNSQDPTQSAKVGDQYAARHDPFVYFHAIIDDQANCDAHVVPLTALAADLQFIQTTPNYVFITPNLCNDGHDAPCVDMAPGGLKSADQFLQTWVPQIVASAAYQRDGLLIITFDEAEGDPRDPTHLDASACCGELPGPSSPLPGIIGLGGGRTGAVLLSPFIKAGSVNDTPYNHYALLKSVEDIFGLDHLGYAGQSGLQGFGPDVFNAAK